MQRAWNISLIDFVDKDYAGKRRKAPDEGFFEKMDRGGTVKGVAQLIEPHYPIQAVRTEVDAEGANLVALSDPAMDESLDDIASLRRFRLPRTSPRDSYADKQRPNSRPRT